MITTLVTGMNQILTTVTVIRCLENLNTFHEMIMNEFAMEESWMDVVVIV